MPGDDPAAYRLAALDNGWRIGRFAALGALRGVVHAVTTRQALDVHLLRRRPVEAANALADALGLEAVAFCNQVHGAKVLHVERGGLAGDADALVTDRVGLGLMGLSADCPLVLVADPCGPAVGVAHASWRGTVAQVARGLVRALRRTFGAEPGNLVACIGPSAGPCCYEVAGEVLDAAVRSLGLSAERFFRHRGGGKLLFDLWAANRDQLLRAGLRRENVHAAETCTICRNELYPSHRAEGEAAGRFAAVVGRALDSGSAGW